MAKINARLSDIEFTERKPWVPDRYTLKIKEIKETTREGRQNFNWEFEVAGDRAEDYKGRVIYHNTAMNLLEGGVNKIGAEEFKRIAAGALGMTKDEASQYDWDSLDSDDLKGMSFDVDVKIKPWTNPTKGTSGEGPVIVPHTITPVGG